MKQNSELDINEADQLALAAAVKAVADFHLSDKIPKDVLLKAWQRMMDFEVAVDQKEALKSSMRSCLQQLDIPGE